MKDRKKVMIIGSGLAGMSAGYYLQCNGFDTEIFELHSSSGGLCTSWKRKNYLIDGCIHFLTGTSPKENTYQFWNDLLDMSSVDFIYQDTHAVVEDESGKRVCLFSNVDKLRDELLAIAPEDKKQILFLVKGIKKFTGMKMPVDKPYELMTLGDKLKVAYQMLPYLYSLRRLMMISNAGFVSRLKNPRLRYAFSTAFIGEFPLFYTVMQMVWRHNKSTGYPKGGASYISGLIENKYRNAGGVIHFNSRVSKILVNDNKAMGIELENGDKHYADLIISAADGYSTIYSLLEGRYKDKKIIERYESGVFKTIDKTLYVSIGVNADFSGQPHKLYIPLAKPIHIDPLTELNLLDITHYCDDIHAAPEGKSLLTLMPQANDWEYWHNLRIDDRVRYDEEKNRIAMDIIEALENRFGNMRNNVEMIDVVTPATYIRYTNNWTGGQISWSTTRNTFGKPTTWQIKGLSNFYMTGQWAGISGGLNSVVMMGNHLTQIICKKEGIPFKRK